MAVHRNIGITCNSKPAELARAPIRHENACLIAEIQDPETDLPSKWKLMVTSPGQRFFKIPRRRWALRISPSSS
jgi:hypothetical protein